MLKKAMYFLFGLSFLTAFNVYANDEIADNSEVEVSANDAEPAAAEVEVADNTDQECSDCGADQDKE